jgi:hypothetical protein
MAMKVENHDDNILRQSQRHYKCWPLNVVQLQSLQKMVYFIR